MLNLDIGVGMLGLSTRAYNALMRNGIETLGDILITPLKELSALSGMGTKSYEEIINKVHSLGYINISEDSSKVTKDVYDSILEYKKKVDSALELKNKEQENIKNKYRFLLYSVLECKLECLNLPINLFYYLKKINLNYIGDILKLDSNTLKKQIADKKIYETLLSILHYNGLLLIDENIEINAVESLNDFINSLEIKILAHEDDELDSIYNALKEIHECKEALYIISERLKYLSNHLIGDYNQRLERKKQVNEE